VHAALAAVEKAHVDLAEVVLGELAEETLEAHHRPRLVRAQLSQQVVEPLLPPA
jgi:hypothetical protein